jgi:hypothetical protein
VTVPASWLGRGREVRLDLGNFVGATLVTELLHAGANSITVQLDTTLLNRNAQLRAAGNPGRYA